MCRSIISVRVGNGVAVESASGWSIVLRGLKVQPRAQ